ncbi:MAG: isoleucyl-tRNA synthetase, partial [Candidatus Berkelbacteria bacterium Licking1014_2]
GNTLLAVGKDIIYSKIQQGQEIFWLAKNRISEIIKGDYQELEQTQGQKLVGEKYIPLFDCYQNIANGFHVAAADFVTTEDGTGIVHIAPAFGEDDFNLGKKEQVEMIQHITIDGLVKPEIKAFAGRSVFNFNDDVIKKLEKEGKVYTTISVTHDYPHCWRCETPLLNYATESWFVNIQKIKDDLLKANQAINWVPEYIKNGRFGNGLKEAPDWAISRNRYWGTPLPIWQCQIGKVKSKKEKVKSKEGCGHIKVVGSAAELEKLSGRKITDIHKHIVDEIIFPCQKCGGEMRRIPEILDCWFESGSMPFALNHYPKEFPADFIAEAQDQTRGWFYTLHVIATAIAGQPSFKNVVVTGMILAGDGKKMSKRLKNYPEPEEVLGKYGADALRFYFLSSPLTIGQSLNFNIDDLDQTYKKIILITRNCLNFFLTYSQLDGWKNSGGQKSTNVLDRWLLSRLHQSLAVVTAELDNYQFNKTCFIIAEFIDDFSTWYIRRSRGRRDNDFHQTCQTALLIFSQMVAPILPFLAESIYQSMRKKDDPESVHLLAWPSATEDLIDEKLNEEMVSVRQAASLAFSQRAEKGIKIRQPLAKLAVSSTLLADSGEKEELANLLKDEVNVKKVIVGKGELKVELDANLTTELKQEGECRELLRQIQNERKKAGLTPGEPAKLFLPDQNNWRQIINKFGDKIKKTAYLSTIEFHQDALKLAKSH